MGECGEKHRERMVKPADKQWLCAALLAFEPRGTVAQQPRLQVLRQAFPAWVGWWQRLVPAPPPRGVASSGCPTFSGGVVVRSYGRCRWPGSGAITVPCIRAIWQVPKELCSKAAVFTGTRPDCSVQPRTLSAFEAMETNLRNDVELAP